MSSRPVRAPASSATLPFADRVAIVTGGTRGIGAAIARRLVAGGAHVSAVFAGDHVAAAKLADELADGPGSVSTHPVDIADENGCRTLVADILAAHGRIDHLVNNA